ncbi:hypothetical protein SAMN02745136_00512 [Anaerocolumna jejuensis DSM 15929]|uniref:Uncharacterized protein n=1 Tax=Anaerocolumna jejuensis DSM 15929 TaxID=1121322 RepID=A0A1M6KMX9_9FIRM|nr:hypothetical protein [Anaerocolumna jejuensis]SHJ60281.1 hypothetical protein SAMN02745136_00512 [Anaerocolumna jejuensis DSM 15929]
MTRVEEARAERAKEVYNNMDPLGLGVVTSFDDLNNAVTDFNAEAKNEAIAEKVVAVKGEVKAEVKAELKVELKDDVKSEVIQDMETRFNELTAHLAEQKQEQRGSLEIDGDDTLHSIGDLQIVEEAYEKERLARAVKEVLPETMVQQQPEPEAKKVNPIRKFFLWLRIKIKNNFIFKMFVDALVSALVMFVIYEGIYLFMDFNAHNDSYNFISSFLTSIDVLKGYLGNLYEFLQKQMK